MTHRNRRLLPSLFVITAIALTWHTAVRGALPSVAAALETEPKWTTTTPTIPPSGFPQRRE